MTSSKAKRKQQLPPSPPPSTSTTSTPSFFSSPAHGDLGSPPVSSTSPPFSPSSSAASPPPVSPFISKLYSIVSNPSTQSLIHWAPHGQSFLVSNEYLFAQHVMRQHFRHTNFSSFVRQLNFYGFHKRATQGGATQFDHPNFKKGREDLLHLIVRKSGGGGGAAEKAAAAGDSAGKGDKAGESYRDEIQQLGEEVRALKAQYSDLAKMQQRILFVFGRYMNAGGGGGDGASRKRFVSEGRDEEEAEHAGAGGSATKRARLLLDNRQSGERMAPAPAGEAAGGGRERGGQGMRRSFPNPLADIDWSDPHAMQELIHSPYLRGAPQVLNSTPLPLELPPLQAQQGTSTPRSAARRSPRPLLLTAREEEKGSGQGRRLNVPPIEVGRRQHVGSGRGVFYDAGDSPSSQSSTSTEAELERKTAGQASESRRSADHFSSAPPLPHLEQHWPNSAHLASNGVIYAPPAQKGAGLAVGSGGGDAWPGVGHVKVEADLESTWSSHFGYPLPSSPSSLDALPPSLALPDLDPALLHTALDTPSSSLLPPLSSSDDAQAELLSPLPFAVSAPPSPLPLLSSLPSSSPMPLYPHSSTLYAPALDATPTASRATMAS